MKIVVGVQWLSHVQLCDPVDYNSPGFPVVHHLLEFVQTHVHAISDAIQPSHPLTPLAPPALSLSQHQEIFSSELALPIGGPKYWSFSFSINPSSLYSRLFCLSIDFFDLCAVKRTLKSLLQHHFGFS